jgi:hypothetical protein
MMRTRGSNRSTAWRTFEQQPLGTTTKVGWAGLKDFHVEVKNIVVYRAEDRVAVTQRLHDRLRRALTPLPVDGGQGRPFGEALRASTIYDVPRAAGAKLITPSARSARKTCGSSRSMPKWVTSRHKR